MGDISFPYIFLWQNSSTLLPPTTSDASDCTPVQNYGNMPVQNYGNMPRMGFHCSSVSNCDEYCNCYHLGDNNYHYPCKMLMRSSPIETSASMTFIIASQVPLVCMHCTG